LRSISGIGVSKRLHSSPRRRSESATASCGNRIDQFLTIRGYPAPDGRKSQSTPPHCPEGRNGQVRRRRRQLSGPQPVQDGTGARSIRRKQDSRQVRAGGAGRRAAPALPHRLAQAAPGRRRVWLKPRPGGTPCLLPSSTFHRLRWAPPRAGSTIFQKRAILNRCNFQSMLSMTDRE